MLFDPALVRQYMDRHKLSIARMARLAGLKSPMSLRGALEGRKQAAEITAAIMRPIEQGVTPPPPPVNGKGRRQLSDRRAAIVAGWGTKSIRQLAAELGCSPQRVGQLARALGLKGQTSGAKNGRTIDAA